MFESRDATFIFDDLVPLPALNFLADKFSLTFSISVICSHIRSFLNLISKSNTLMIDTFMVWWIRPNETIIGSLVPQSNAFSLYRRDGKHCDPPVHWLNKGTVSHYHLVFFTQLSAVALLANNIELMKAGILQKLFLRPCQIALKSIRIIISHDIHHNASWE